jgi:outer membrane protein assembly factor BamB
LFVAFAALVVAFGGQLIADDWTQWRGNNRDGKSAETGLLDSWPAGGPALLWQANDLGGGYSTPSSADGVLYMIVNDGSDEESVLALSLEDGEKLWSTKIGAVGENQGPQYPGSRSTPTIDGDSLYALGSDGDLACLSLDGGGIRWTKDLRSEFGGNPGKWAYSESPLVDGDKLICSPGGADATVVALDKASGSVVWKTPLAEADDASFSSPIAATIDGVNQYILFLSKGVVGLNAETGDLLWRYSKTSDRDANIQTPVTSGSFVYTAASRVGGGLVKVAGSKSEPTEVYFAKTMPSGIGGSILVDGYLYGSAGSTVMCIDYESGETQWQDRSIGASSLCYADGKIFLHSDDDNTVAMIAATAEEYRELGKFTPPNPPQRVGRAKAWTYPIIVDGKLVIRDAGTVWCYSIAE